jgi:hypothetical protein
MKKEDRIKRSKSIERQVLGVLKAVEGGRTVGEVCRETGISTATYFKWKAKYGGMEASDMRRLRYCAVSHLPSPSRSFSTAPSLNNS